MQITIDGKEFDATEVHVEELSGKSLDYAIALIDKANICARWIREYRSVVIKTGNRQIESYSPTSSPKHYERLQTKYGVSISYFADGHWAGSMPQSDKCAGGDTPLLATYRTIVLNVIGSHVLVPTVLLS